MTRAGVLVTNTPSSMPRPVATIALTFLLALAGKLFLKDRLTRSGRWHERMDNMGLGLTGRTLGHRRRSHRSESCAWRTFDLKLIAAIPLPTTSSSTTSARARSTQAARSRFRRRLLPLNERTRHWSAQAFALMRPTAYFINVARGPIVDERRPSSAAQLRRRRGARRLRAGADRPHQPAARHGQRDRNSAFAVLDHECFHNMASTDAKASSTRFPSACPSLSSIASIEPSAREGVARAMMHPAQPARTAAAGSVTAMPLSSCTGRVSAALPAGNQPHASASLARHRRFRNRRHAG